MVPDPAALDSAASGSPSSAQHHVLAASKGVIHFAIITVSDTRTQETDDSGQLIRQLVEAAGHAVSSHVIVRDEPDQVSAALDAALGGPAQIAVINGGTGISRRDRTYDVISRRLERVLAGFGEIFRMLSYHEVGAAAMLSRATAGTIGDTVVVSLPGSPNAVRLGMERLVLPEAQHLAWELTR